MAAQEGEARERGTGLRGFVEQTRGKQHRVIEMRITLIGSFGMAARVFSSDNVSDTTAISAFALVATCFIVIIMSTWLDYFPARLSDIKPRVAEGQGIPMACLFLPMVCCAAIFCAMNNATQLLGLLPLYLHILCALSACSVLGTIVHSIPHPNHVVIYNFAIMGIAWAMHVWLKVPFWPVMVSMIIYSLLGTWLLYTFPQSFTLGEAMIVSQGITIMLLDTGLQLFDTYGFITLPHHMSVHRSEALLYLEVLVCGVFLCCLLFCVPLYKVAVARLHHEKKFWSGTFLLLSASLFVMIVLPWLQRLLHGKGPVSFVLLYTFNWPVRLVLVVYWLLVSMAAAVVACAQSLKVAWLAPFKVKDPSSLWMRKWFHLFALLVYVPGVALDPNFLSLAASLVTFLFVVAEVVRYFRIWPFGDRLYMGLKPLIDSRDSGPLVLTHIYLLMGFSLPVWLCPLRHYHQASKLSMYAGVLALGIGDSVAAVAGKLMGRTKWPGTSKTIEGTLMSVMTQMLGVLLIVLIDPDLFFFTGRQWAIVAGSLAVTAALEAYTLQIDNLILGLFQFALLISFL